MGQARLVDIDGVQIRERVDERQPDALSHVRVVLDLRRLFVPHDDTVPAFHDVEDRADDLRVVAEQVDPWGERIRGMDRREPAKLSRHVVSSRRDRSERGTPDHQIGRPKSDVIREVRMAPRELIDLHGQRQVEAGDVA